MTKPKREDLLGMQLLKKIAADKRSREKKKYLEEARKEAQRAARQKAREEEKKKKAEEKARNEAEREKRERDEREAEALAKERKRKQDKKDKRERDEMEAWNPNKKRAPSPTPNANNDRTVSPLPPSPKLNPSTCVGKDTGVSTSPPSEVPHLVYSPAGPGPSPTQRESYLHPGTEIGPITPPVYDPDDQGFSRGALDLAGRWSK